MTFSRRHFLAGAAGFAAWPLLESPVAAQLSVHPSEDKKLPPVAPDEPIEGPVFLKCGPMLGHVAPDRALIWRAEMETSTSPKRKRLTEGAARRTRTFLES